MLQINGVNLFLIRVRKTLPQAVKKKPLAKIRKLHRLGKPLRRRHSAECLHIKQSIRLRFQRHNFNHTNTWSL